MKKFLLLSVLAFLCAEKSVQAKVPYTLPLQGVLADSDGKAINESVDFRIAVYEKEVGGDELWIEEQEDVFVNRGLFALYLVVDDDLFDIVTGKHDELWIGIGVNGEDLGRTQLGSALYAQEAEVCNQIGDLKAEEIQPVLSGANSCPTGQYLRGWDGAPICSPDLDTKVSQAEVESWARGVCYDDPQEVLDTIVDICVPVEHSHSWADLDPASIPADIADGDDYTIYESGPGLNTSDTTTTNGEVRTFSVDFSQVARANHNHDELYAISGHSHVNSTRHVIVSSTPGEGEFSSITEAVESVAVAAQGSQTAYVVELRAGTYEEDVIVPPYVHLKGSGRGATIIKGFASYGVSPVPKGTVELQDNTSIRDLTVVNLGTEAISAAVYIAESGTNVLISRVDVRATGANNLNIGILVGAQTQEVEIEGTSVTASYGASNIALRNAGQVKVTDTTLTCESKGDLNVALHNGVGAQARVELWGVRGIARNAKANTGVLNDSNYENDNGSGTVDFWNSALSIRTSVFVVENGDKLLGLDNQSTVFSMGASFDIRGGRVVTEGIMNTGSVYIQDSVVRIDVAEGMAAGIINDGITDQASPVAASIKGVGTQILLNSRMPVDGAVGVRTLGPQSTTSLSSSRVEVSGPAACGGAQDCEKYLPEIIAAFNEQGGSFSMARGEAISNGINSKGLVCDAHSLCKVFGARIGGSVFSAQRLPESELVGGS